MRARMPPRQKSFIKQTKSLQQGKCANTVRHPLGYDGLSFVRFLVG
jgi:hypothetical protein